MPARPADSPPGSLSGAPNDPLSDKAFKGPGIWRSLRETFGSRRRLLDVAQIEVTSLCGGGCVYCPHTTMREHWKARHMAPETYARLWPLLLETGRVHLQGWGEPLLHPRFLDFVRVARRADCLVSTTTCGLVMNEPLAEGIVASGIDIIAFSLTGVTEAANNAARKGVPLERLLSSIRMLQEVRRRKMGVHLEVHFAYLMLAGAMKEVLLLPELMRDLGVHAAVVSTLDYVPSPEWSAEAFAPGENEKIAEARALLQTAAQDAAAKGLALYYSLPLDRPRPTCLERPERSVYVDADGVLAPCIYVNLPHSLDDPMRRVYGSCRDEDPLAIWQKPAFAAFREALASCGPDAPCLNCPKRFAAGNRETVTLCPDSSGTDSA